MLSYGAPTEWDRRIMESFPHVADLASPRDFDAATAWARDVIRGDGFTWKGPRFFFRRLEDRMLFTMRWG